MVFTADSRRTFREKWKAFSERPGVKRAAKVIQYSLLAAVIVYLIYKLSTVGWAEVFGALPETPLFYLLFLLRYLALPLSEIPAYELVWKRPLWRHFTAFIRNPAARVSCSSSSAPPSPMRRRQRVMLELSRGFSCWKYFIPLKYCQ